MTRGRTQNLLGARAAAWLGVALALLAILAVLAALWIHARRDDRPGPPPAIVRVVTIAGDGPRLDAAGLSDPFGIAVGHAGELFVTDGAAGRLVRIGVDGSVATVVEGLDMPSAVAPMPDGTLVVANTGASTIVRVDPALAATTVLAGVDGERGFADGPAQEARFDAPVGVAAGPDGTVYVADTYNDRIRAIAPDGTVRTVAGAVAGYADGYGVSARFDTPCGVLLAPDGALVVADSGNHRVRRVDPTGAVTTIAGTGESDERDGPLEDAAFSEPAAVALRDERSLYVADAAGSTIRVIQFGPAPGVVTLAGAWPPALSDGVVAEARFNRPSALAVGKTGALYVADSGNGLVRAVVAEDETLGRVAAPGSLPLAPAEIRAAVPPRWPFDPPDAPREIAATFGEIRGERRGDRPVWWHNGLDIPGAYGETVRAIHGERVALPLAVDGVGGPRERIRFPLFGYIHLRVGRDQDDVPFATNGVTLRRDERGKVAAVRVRRGTRFAAGDPVGTLNNQNHVHMIAGPSRGEVNALAALELPGLRDGIAPVIEGIAVVGPDYAPLADAMPRGRGAPPRAESTALGGRARILVRAYDRMDGNAERRRLGLYAIGYQVLHDDGSPAPGFEAPVFNLVFERLPQDPASAGVAYAEGSQSGYTGATVFTYEATNVARDGDAREGFWDASALVPGRYIVRVFAEDFHGNRSTRDLAVTVAGQ